MLWHFAGEFTPRGDIGKLADADIAEAVAWVGSSEELIAGLVEVRWLDRDPTYRLLIHDWSEHCDDAVRKKLHRAKHDFVTPTIATCPPIVRTPSGQSPDSGGHTRAEGQGKARQGSSQEGGVGETALCDAPLDHAPEIAAAGLTPAGFDDSPEPTYAGRTLPEWSERLYLRHPKKRDKVLVSGCLMRIEVGWHPLARRAKVKTRDELFDLIDRAHSILSISIDWTKEGGKFAPRLAEWLEDEGWLGVPARASPEPDTPGPVTQWRREKEAAEARGEEY